MGQLIAESTKSPFVIPLWHVGMEDILPARSPYIPQLFKVRVVKQLQVRTAKHAILKHAAETTIYHAGPLSGLYCWCRHVVLSMVQSEISKFA